MECECDNAALYRDRITRYLQQERFEQSRSSLDDSIRRLSKLFSLRDEISREMESGQKAAAAMRREAANRNQARAALWSHSHVQQLERFRNSMSYLQQEYDMAESTALRRLIDVEKAKQLARTATDSLKTTAPGHGRTFQDPIEDVLTSLGSRTSKYRKSVSRKRVSQPPRAANRIQSPSVLAPLSHRIQDSKAKLDELNQRIRSRNEVSAKAPDTDDLRRSINSIRNSRDRFDEFLAQTAEIEEYPRPSSPVPAREVLDPSKRTERKRAALAALKLKTRT